MITIRFLPRLFLHRVVHTVLSLIMIWLGWCYIHSRPVFTSVNTYEAMAGMMDETHWAIFAFVFAGIGVVTSFFNYWLIRAAGAGLLAFAHALIAFLVLIGNPNGTISGLFFGYAVLGAALSYSATHNGTRYSKNLAPSDLP